MASFDPLKTMSFTKWFAIMDYVASLGFKTTELGTDIKSLADSKLLSNPSTVGLLGIQTPDNGKSITHALGWDMTMPDRYNRQIDNSITLRGKNWAQFRLGTPTLPAFPKVTRFGSMVNYYSELTSHPELQSSIMFAFGEWFDGVQAQVSTPSVFNSIDFTNTKGKGSGALKKSLKLIAPFENAFDHLGLDKKLVKQLVDSKTGLLTESKYQYSTQAKDWHFNTPYFFAYQFARGVGKLSKATARREIIKYFYNQSKYLPGGFNDPAKAMQNSGPRPFRYFGYPQTSIIAISRYPSSSLATATGPVTVPTAIEGYKYSNNGSLPAWQTIADPVAIFEFAASGTKPGKTTTPLRIIRSLSQYGSANKVGGSMRVKQIATSGRTTAPCKFPNLDKATNPDYQDVGYWAVGQSSPNEFKSIITAVVNDPSPTMASLIGAAPKRGATAAPGKKTKPVASAPLVASKGPKPSKPKREFSPEGVKVTISNFTKSDTFPMGNSWLVLNITPDQAIYNKIMKGWENTQIGTMKGMKKVTPPKNWIKQYPKLVQLAFRAGSTLLINTNGKTKPEWKDYKWDRDKDVITVAKDSRFTFIDNDPRKGMSFALHTSIGTIDVKTTYDEATKQTVTTIGEWFKDGAIELRVEVGYAKGSIMLPINVMTAPTKDVSVHTLIDTNLAVEWFQRPAVLYPPKELLTDSYPDAWTVFGTEIEVDYFNADSLAKKRPLMFQAIPFDQSTAKKIDITKEFIELELFIETNTDTYTGFDYIANTFTSEMIVFPCDERYLALKSIKTDPATGETITKLIEPTPSFTRGEEIAAIWVSKEGDQAKIEFKMGDTIIMPDEVNRGFSAIENNNQQELTGLITQLKVKKYRIGAAELPKEMRIIRTMKNITPSAQKKMSYEDSAGEEILSGTGSLIYEDANKIINVILPHPDPDKGLVKFKLNWKVSV